MTILLKNNGPYLAYCDGACKGNPGPGGWGLVIYKLGEQAPLEEHCGGDKATTNNKMELQAAIETLKRLEPGAEIEIRTDSQYVIQGLTSWMKGWKSRNWRTAGGDPVKNEAQWQELDSLYLARKVKLTWVKGHAGVAGNERADALANAGIAQA